MSKCLTISIVSGRTSYRTASGDIYRQSTVSSAWASTSQKSFTSLINSLQIHVDRFPCKSVRYFYPTLTRTHWQVVGKSQIRDSTKFLPVGIALFHADGKTETYDDANCGYSQTALRNRFKQAPHSRHMQCNPFFRCFIINYICR